MYIGYFYLCLFRGVDNFLFLKMFKLFPDKTWTNKDAIWILHVHGHLASPAVVDRVMLFIPGATEL